MAQGNQESLPWRVAWHYNDTWSPFSNAYRSNRERQSKTQTSQTRIWGFPWQNAEGRAFRHAWVIIGNQLKKRNTSQIRDRLKSERLAAGEVWVSVQRRGQTLKKAGSGHFELLSKSEKDESSPWHQPNSLTHTHIHSLTHARTHRGVSG